MTKSVFSSDLRVTGDVTSKGDLDIHGHVEGALDVRGLTVAHGATVVGTVRAAAADIAGRVEGEVACDRVAIEPSGVLEGTVSYRTLSVRVGGCLNARCAPTPGAPAGATEPLSDSRTAQIARAPGRSSPRRPPSGTAARQAIDATA